MPAQTEPQLSRHDVIVVFLVSICLVDKTCISASIIVRFLDMLLLDHSGSGPKISILYRAAIISLSEFGFASSCSITNRSNPAGAVM